VGALPLFAAATTYFLANTLPIAAVISLTEQKSLIKIHSECYFWSFPYYLFGGGILGLASDWSFLLIVPAVYAIYRSYRLYLERLEYEKRQCRRYVEFAPPHH